MPHTHTQFLNPLRIFAGASCWGVPYREPRRLAALRTSRLDRPCSDFAAKRGRLAQDVVAGCITDDVSRSVRAGSGAALEGHCMSPRKEDRQKSFAIKAKIDHIDESKVWNMRGSLSDISALFTRRAPSFSRHQRNYTQGHGWEHSVGVVLRNIICIPLGLPRTSMYFRAAPYPTATTGRPIESVAFPSRADGFNKRRGIVTGSMLSSSNSFDRYSKPFKQRKCVSGLSLDSGREGLPATKRTPIEI